MIILTILLVSLISCHKLNSELKVTYVTGFWDVGRGKSLVTPRNLDYYLSFLLDVVQSDIQLVIFGNEDIRAFVNKNQVYKDKIYFIDKNLSEFENYWYTSKIWGVIDEAKKDQLKWLVYSYMPQYNYRMYNPVVMSKLRLIKQANDVNPFNADYFAWIDGGITHSIPKFMIQGDYIGNFLRSYQVDWTFYTVKGTNWKPFRFGFKDQGRTYMNISTQQRQYVWGNWLGGKATAVSTVYHIYQNFLRYTLENMDMNTDQGVFFMMLERYSYLIHRSTAAIECYLNLNTSINADSYALREIKVSDLQKHVALMDSNKPCNEQPQQLVDIYHLKNELVYFNRLDELYVSSIHVRLYILIGIIFVFILNRSMLGSEIKKMREKIIMTKKQRNDKAIAQ